MNKTFILIHAITWILEQNYYYLSADWHLDWYKIMNRRLADLLTTCKLWSEQRSGLPWHLHNSHRDKSPYYININNSITDNASTPTIVASKEKYTYKVRVFRYKIVWVLTYRMIKVGCGLDTSVYLVRLHDYSSYHQSIISI